MKTDPRIHDFMFLWKPVGGVRADTSYYIHQPIYYDGAFHTYLIRLDIRPSWTGRISEIALGWTGVHGSVEVKQLALRSATLQDRIRVTWAQFWIPQTLNARTVNAIAGPVLFGHAFALPLALLFLVLLPVMYRAHRHGLRRRAAVFSALTPTRVPPWLYTASATFLILWLLYDLRETYNHAQTLRSEFRYFLGDAPRPRHHFELDDFYDVIDAIQSVVPSENPIGFFSSRPLFVKARYFLFPRQVFDREFHPDYLVVFQDPNITYRRGQLSEKDMVVVDRVTPFGRFGEDAFIYKRIHD